MTKTESSIKAEMAKLQVQLNGIQEHDIVKTIKAIKININNERKQISAIQANVEKANQRISVLQLNVEAELQQLSRLQLDLQLTRQEKNTAKSDARVYQEEAEAKEQENSYSKCKRGIMAVFRSPFKSSAATNLKHLVKEPVLSQIHKKTPRLAYGSPLGPTQSIPRTMSLPGSTAPQQLEARNAHATGFPSQLGQQQRVQALPQMGNSLRSPVRHQLVQRNIQSSNPPSHMVALYRLQIHPQMGSPSHHADPRVRQHLVQRNTRSLVPPSHMVTQHRLPIHTHMGSQSQHVYPRVQRQQQRRPEPSTPQGHQPRVGRAPQTQSQPRPPLEVSPGTAMAPSGIKVHDQTYQRQPCVIQSGAQYIGGAMQMPKRASMCMLPPTAHELLAAKDRLKKTKPKTHEPAPAMTPIEQLKQKIAADKAKANAKGEAAEN